MLFLNLNKTETENEQKDTFVASIIHDLKNPLIAQKHILEKIIKNNVNCYTTEDCKLMLTSTCIMLDMILSVMDIYKYNNGKINYNFQQTNINNIIFDVIKELTYLTEEENFFNIKHLEENCNIIIDSLHIRRVISNLISNAIRYKKDNTKIDIDTYSDKNFFYFSISNIGHYISPELQKCIFNKYVTNKSKFNSIGTGLGLYISKQIINSHNGQIYLESSQDGLNTFAFTISKKLPKTHSHSEETSKIN